MAENASQPPSLEIVDELEYGAWKATVLKTALELEVFSVVARGHHTLEDIAAAAGCDEWGMRKLLCLQSTGVFVVGALTGASVPTS